MLGQTVLQEIAVLLYILCGIGIVGLILVAAILIQTLGVKSNTRYVVDWLWRSQNSRTHEQQQPKPPPVVQRETIRTPVFPGDQ